MAPLAASVLAVVGVLVVVACAPRRGSESPVEKTARRFLDAMVQEDEAAMAAMLSPAWLEESGVDISTTPVNRFSPQAYEVKSVSGNRVTAVIQFFPATHRLVLEVVEEEGSQYIRPGSISDQGTIQPWVELERFAE